MTDVPTFGEKIQGVTYVDRYAAYIIIQNDRQEVVLVQAPNGAYFLPGGEIEGLETQVEAIHREVMEELGFNVEIDREIGRGDDYFYSRHRDTYYHNPAYFFSAKAWEKKCAPLEDFNEIDWFSVEEAAVRLKRGSHQWALQEWLKEQSEDA